MTPPFSFDIRVKMAVDLDGAPNAYGPPARNSDCLDDEKNAHRQSDNVIVGYLTKKDAKGRRDGKTPVVQKAGDPFPGLYVSTSGYEDVSNPNEEDPRRYVNATEINYVVLASKAKNAGVKPGDFVVVHSVKTRQTVFAIVGDTGNSTGAEGSVALLKRLGYKGRIDGRSGPDMQPGEIVVRYFPVKGSNKDRRFFFLQSELDGAAGKLGLDTDFSALHPGDPGKLTLATPGNSGPALVPAALPFVPMSDKSEPPLFPGQKIELNSSDEEATSQIQQRLRSLGFTEPGPKGPQPLTVDGDFGTNTKNAVTLFQSRHLDANGMQLVADGGVGSLTWGALFGGDTVPQAAAPARGVLKEVLSVAAGEVGVVEDPPGTNRGKRVEEYQASAGADPGDAWCVAFIYWCFKTASAGLGVNNPMKPVRTAGVADLWNKCRNAGITTITHDQAVNAPSLLKPGMIFIIVHADGLGHAGIIVSVQGGRIETIEGNTNSGDGSREGIGVFHRVGASMRSIESITRGFISF